MSLRHGSFLALGYESMPVQAFVRWLTLALGRPNHYLHALLTPEPSSGLVLS